mmetsp:Transcript_23591/g.75728  ORF Transcript_23591/g.75728 Transcript_23591/m.75728 type:complete len:499 (+) Transcript_23591:2587-4083(+)
MRELHSVAWSCDDSLIICASYKPHKSRYPEVPGEQRVDVFDALRGTKLRTLAGAHDYASFALAPHPQVRNCLLTGGHDGALWAWDLSARTPRRTPALVEKPNLAEEDVERSSYNDVGVGNDAGSQLDEAFLRFAGTGDGAPAPPPSSEQRAAASTQAVSSPGVPGEIWSITWSPDGSRFAAVDLAGQLHVFFGKKEEHPPAVLGQAPRHQYLASDYAELVWDANSYALDAATRVAPHLAPREFFRNYLSQTSGAHHDDNDDDFVPLVDARDLPHKQRDGSLLPAATAKPLALSAAEQRRRLGRLDDTRRLLEASLSKEAYAEAFTDARNLSYDTLAVARFWWPEAADLDVAKRAGRFDDDDHKDDALLPCSRERPQGTSASQPASGVGVGGGGVGTVVVDVGGGARVGVEGAAVRELAEELLHGVSLFVVEGHGRQRGFGDALGKVLRVVVGVEGGHVGWVDLQGLELGPVGVLVEVVPREGLQGGEAGRWSLLEEAP